MSKINALCVYCGSSPGTDPAFVETAQNFGKILAENEIRLVYGGGSTGLMGALASAVLDHGGEVTGIIPEFLTKRERPRRLPQELIVTTDMHDRKWRMFERADGFVALPGGIGTLEELVEQLTWVQLGRHKKPILIANINGYWDPLLDADRRICGRKTSCRRRCGWITSSPAASRTFCRRCAKPRAHVAEAEKTMAVPVERL